MSLITMFTLLVDDRNREIWNTLNDNFEIELQPSAAHDYQCTLNDNLRYMLLQTK